MSVLPVGIPVAAGLFDQFSQLPFAIAGPDIDTLVRGDPGVGKPVFLLDDPFDRVVALVFFRIMGIAYADQLLAVFPEQCPGAVLAGAECCRDFVSPPCIGDARYVREQVPLQLLACCLRSGSP